MKAKLDYKIMRGLGKDMGFTEDSLGWIDAVQYLEDNNGFVNLDEGLEGQFVVTSMRFIIRKEWVKEWL
jgi:hypothetical protein